MPLSLYLLTTGISVLTDKEVSFVKFSNIIQEICEGKGSNQHIARSHLISIWIELDLLADFGIGFIMDRGRGCERDGVWRQIFFSGISHGRSDTKTKLDSKRQQRKTEKRDQRKEEQSYFSLLVSVEQKPLKRR